jgi:hypothetical protein
MFAFILGKGFNPDAYRLSELETYKVFSRSQYFGEGLGNIYKNRFGLFYFDKVYPLGAKFQTVFFSSLNPVLIFLPLYGFLIIWGNEKNKVKNK